MQNLKTQPYGETATADMQTFRKQKTTGVNFAGPLEYKVPKSKKAKYYILIFTCTTSRAVHHELTKTKMNYNRSYQLSSR